MIYAIKMKLISIELNIDAVRDCDWLSLLRNYLINYYDYELISKLLYPHFVLYIGEGQGILFAINSFMCWSWFGPDPESRSWTSTN